MILDRLAQQARLRVAEAIARQPRAQLAAELDGRPVRAQRPFEEALRGPGLALICEFKRASPSRGPIAPDADIAQQLKRYAAGGAAAISCLTEPSGFMARETDFAEARAAVRLPLLQKDFVVDAYQIDQAALQGADAILLIVALLPDDELAALLAHAEGRGLSALVECHDEAEIRRAVAVGARIIGVNNRDLRSFSVDRDNARRLCALVPGDRLYVAESGVRSAEDLLGYARAGATPP